MVIKQTQFLKSTPFSFHPFTTSQSIPSSSSTDISSLNRMITIFSKSGDLISAQRVFDEMPERDLVSWNSLMGAYANNARFEESLRLFSTMHNLNLGLNNTSLSTATTCCAKLRDIDQGRQIHGLAVKLRASANVFVGTSLITMYAKCNVVDCLTRVFDGIEYLNVSAWNALISGLVFNRWVGAARELFDRMPDRNVVSWTAMINGYLEVQRVRAALELFDSMPVKNPVTWSVMLRGFVTNEKYKEAIIFFSRMMYEGVHANGPSITVAVTACSSLKSIELGRTVHGIVIKLGFHLNHIIQSALVFMYCECLHIEDAKLEFAKMECKFIGSWNSLMCGYINSKNLDEARMIFDNMNIRDNITWNLMVKGYLEDNKIDEAFEMFVKMPEPTIEAITALMSGLIENRRIDEARKLFNMIPQVDIIAYNTLIFGYIEEGQLERSIELFNKMRQRSVVTFNIMISGFLHHGRVDEAYKLFNECSDKDSITWSALIFGLVRNNLNDQAIQLFKKMLSTDTIPSELALTSLISSSAKQSIQILGEQLHTISIKLGLDHFLVVKNSLIAMYSKCGFVSMAEILFNETVKKDVVTWNSMIYGYALHGLGKEAIDMFNNMIRVQIKPDNVTFLGVLYACNHSCFLKEAQYYFNCMGNYGIAPTLPHYACMMDLFCRMGMVEEAERLVQSMPYEPDSIVWTSILSGCRLNGDVELAKYAADQVLGWDAMDKMPYLNLMSVYKSAGRWDELKSCSDQVTGFGAKKQPGCSWI